MGCPIAFERNLGQTDPSVDFLARGSGYSLFLVDTTAVLTLANPAAGDPDENLSADRTATVLRVQLVGGNPAAPVSGFDPLPGRSNYLRGNDPAAWVTDVPTYAGVIYDDVYDGIDLIYRGNPSELEYDFVVAPHADPGLIELQFVGAEGIALDASGNLIVRTSGGDLIERAL